MNATFANPRRNGFRALYIAASMTLPPAAVALEFDAKRDLDGDYLPIAQALQQQMEVLPALSKESLDTWRDAAVSTDQKIAESPPWREQLISGPEGAPNVRVYVVNAGKVGERKPAILHMHGGGYVVGQAKDSIPQLQGLASDLDCVIVTVDYRLAPETPFPGSLEDNYAALKWLHENATGIGVDASRIAVMGESAGGGHAAALAIAARDRQEIPLLLQVLIYPMLDDRTGSTRDVAPHIGTLFWRASDNRFGWTSLLGTPAGAKAVPYGSVPARVQNLEGLAPAFIAVGGLDLFVDENIEYAKRLNSAGVPAELIVIPRIPHGFAHFPNTRATKTYRHLLLDALKGAFADR